MANLLACIPSVQLVRVNNTLVVDKPIDSTLHALHQAGQQQRRVLILLSLHRVGRVRVLFFFFLCVCSSQSHVYAFCAA